MAYRATSTVMVVRHADTAPDAADWNACMEALGAAAVGKLLVWSPGVASPNSEQRASAVATLRAKGPAFRASVMTRSKVARGVATAISWFGPKVRAFSLEELQKAIDHLEVDESEWAEIRAVVDELGREVIGEAAGAL